jgi:hypothetical protein
MTDVKIAVRLVAETLGLKLSPPRTSGYDALRGSEPTQVKGRAHGKTTNSGQKMGRIKTDGPCDTVPLVVLDNATPEPRKIWEAEFTQIARRVWPLYFKKRRLRDGNVPAQNGKGRRVTG